MFPPYVTMPSPHSSFRQRPSYQHQKRPCCHWSAPTYSVNNLTNVQHSPNWHGLSRASSPYIYKNPQNTVDASRLIQERGSSCSTSPNSRRHNRNSGTVYLAEQFDVNDYVIPAMTSNPWAKLEKFYASR
ncbi:hypothetical protein LOAG_04968 [Loa loa]|uniref:Uncharacterized protein n=1 Tax=Loa loa TaxID=7209 RepID=A0A1S0U0V5_LOALO|nr:hypothetical protein LOAG_04968 [Loa loa]EFO23514.1 hypothetical protein LOAG_04968 [Loa loa]